ncbi:MAG: ATP-binding protein [candidate division Zixibacteria bacterium]|nr:ATP-binding protein [candidate division Zixibacteria bacterium]MCI0597081.1 ATP-binding protein [candidate division Zixibacteria bacterium]
MAGNATKKKKEPSAPKGFGNTDKLSVKSVRPSPPKDILEEMNTIIEEVRKFHPRLDVAEGGTKYRHEDLVTLLYINKVISSSLFSEDILFHVMQKAVEFLKAERGFLMLKNESGELEFKTAHNIQKELLSDEDYRISSSIATKVAESGKSIYLSDAQNDPRFSAQESIKKLHLRSVMCVPLKVKEEVIGIIYLDSTTQTRPFLETELYLFELFAGQAAIAIENARLYDSVFQLKRYNEEVINHTPVGMLVLNEGLEVTTANRAAYKIFGKEPGRDSYGPVTLTAFLPADHVAYWEETCEEVIKTGRSFEEPRYYLTRGKEEVVLAWKAHPLATPNRKSNSAILVVDDITEKVLLEKYIILSEKLAAKEEMAASVGHELNNYLSIISSNTEMLMLNIKKSAWDKVSQNCAAVLEHIGKMRRFTDSLMDFSKLEPEMREFDLRRLVEDLLFSLKPQKSFAHVRFFTHLPANLPPVTIDVGQVQQVFFNLIKNAAEALKDSGKPSGAIEISAAFRPEKQEIELKVKDDGPGIPPENLTRIFEPRFTTKPTGHGLGLANCRRIMEAHDGQILVESRSGAGTTFVLSFPVSTRP